MVLLRSPSGPGPARGRAGFTVVELIVTLAIIAVLLGLLLPALGVFRAQGRSMQCLHGLRSIGQSVIAYVGDHRDYYPLSSHATGSNRAPDAWLQSLVEYGVTEHSRFCPDDHFADMRLTSYATNDHFEPLVAGIDYDPFTGERLPGGRARAFQRSAEIPAPAALAYAVETVGEGTLDHIHSIGWTEPDEIAGEIAVDRHHDGANYLFADGHVAPLAWGYLQETFTAETSLFDPETAR